MNAPLNTGLQQIIEQINGATADLRETEEWFRCRDGYIRDAVAGTDDDWTRWDDEANSNALLTIQAAFNQSPEEFKRTTMRAIAGLIQHAATGHATQMRRNGRLEVA